MPHCYIDLARPIKLGRNVGVGGGSYLFTHGMWLSKLEGFPVSYGGITIDNDVWLPWGCFVMPNVKIGSRVVVGARAVITKDLPSGVLAAGVPAKVLRANASTDVTSEERAEILVQITEALASKIGARVRIERTPDGERHLLDDQVALFVHRRDDSGLAAPPVLNVVPGPLNGALAQQFVLWSLRDSTSSPYAMISSRARQWFARARSMGVRFYPIDEDLE